jgi:hypothetical protein
MIIITFRYIARNLAKLIALLAALSLLSGCLGGTVAQQIVRSIATSVVDKSLARAMDVEEGDEYSQSQYAAADKLSTENNAMQRNFMQATGSPTNVSPQNNAKQTVQLQEAEPDDLTYMLATASFQPVRPISEPLPTEVTEPEVPANIVRANQLVRVELFNLLIGAEKNAVYEEARLIGASGLPQKHEWQLWQVGVGAIEHTNKMITFLIPPEFGKLPSGSKAMVELASPGELNIARYEPSNLRYKQLSGFNQTPNLKQASGL